MPVFNLWLEGKGIEGSYIGFIAPIPWISMWLLQQLGAFSAALLIAFPLLSAVRVSIVLMIIW